MGRPKDLKVRFLKKWEAYLKLKALDIACQKADYLIESHKVGYLVS